MRLLLDTHTFLWFVGGYSQISGNARTLIEDSANQPLLSIASLWEIAIKVSLGKLTIRQPFETFLAQELLSSGLTILGVGLDHISAVAKLPFYHRDPFARLLVAQVIVEDIPLLSADPALMLIQ